MRWGKYAAIAAAAVLLSACGGTSAGSGTQVAQANQGLPIIGKTVKYDPNKLVNDGKPVDLELWTWGSQKTFQALVDDYRKIHPNVSVKVVLQPWEDYWTRLPLELNSGRGPALFNVHNSYHDNIVKRLEPYDIPVADLAADYRGVEAHVVDGKVPYIDYGLMTGLIFYNKDMWAAAGLTDADIPKTWDEFTKVAQRLTKREGDSFTQAGFSFNGAGSNFTLGLPYQLGHNLMKPDLKAPDIDNPATLAVVQRFRDLYDVAKVGSKDFGQSADESFGQGQVAMVYNWGHFQSSLQENYPGIKFGTFRTPTPDAGTPYAFDRYNGESTLGINAGASPEQKAVAQDLVRFSLTNTAFLKEMSLGLGVVPLYAPLADDPEVKANPVVAAVGDLSRYVWPGPMPSTFEKSIDTMWQEVLYNGVAPQQALATAQAAIVGDLGATGFVSVENKYGFYKPSP